MFFHPKKIKNLNYKITDCHISFPCINTNNSSQ